MKKQLSLIASGLLIAGTMFSQSSVWEVSKNGNTLYLGGSVHVLREQDYPLPVEFDKAFEKSSVLVLEADVAQMANPEVVQQMMQQATLPGEETLKTILNAETYNLLETTCAEFSFPLQNAIKLKPAMIVNVLTILKMQQVGFNTDGVDAHYMEKATAENRKIDFLETIDFQINMLMNMGTGYENEYVKYSLDDFDNISTEIEQLIPEWRNGTSEFLSSESREMKEKFPTVYKSLFTERNNNWLPKIETYLTDESVEFIVVGLAHLQGDDGLLLQLKNKGYTVKQVK